MASFALDFFFFKKEMFCMVALEEKKTISQPDALKSKPTGLNRELSDFDAKKCRWLQD